MKRPVPFIACAALALAVSSVAGQDHVTIHLKWLHSARFASIDRPFYAALRSHTS